MPKTSYFLESVDRVMQVLNCFEPEQPELRLTDLSLRLGMPKPQVLRIVFTLEKGGYLVRDPETKRYRLGLRLFQLGMIVRQQMSLRRVAQPVLQHLACATEETVALFHANHTGVICVDVIESPKGLRIFAEVGRRMPWNAGAAGKVIFAYLPEEVREAILEGAQFQRFTDRTVIDPDKLRKMLDDIRTVGHSVAVGDLDADALGVSAPIFDSDGQIAGAVSVGGPTSRVSDQSVTEIIELVRAGAAEISRGLGYDENGRQEL